jgi:aldehyde dehydrogenase (NAD+)
MIQILNSTALDISTLLQSQRTFFATGQTRNLEFRRSQLLKLQQAIITSQDLIIKAVHEDLGRPPFEAYFEIASLAEIKLALKNLKKWNTPRKAAISIDAFPATAWIQPEPLGVILVIGPWNYPFQLVMTPLIGAIAAGNCAILKPSEFAPHTSAVVAAMIAEIFAPEFVAVVEGDKEVSQQLLAEKFDHIFFTGGTATGKLVMAAAAQHLTPVTLELGGKSPCIVDRSAPLEIAAKRIAWGKFLNAGQTCIAPDYLLVDATIKDEFKDHLLKAIKQLYGNDPASSKDFCRIINLRQLERLEKLLASGQVLIGGKVDREQRYFAPTVLDQVSWDDPVMAEEIFGPILPLLTYDGLDDAINQINAHAKPLALYLFSTDRQKQEQVLTQTSSGGVCINDTVIQVSVNSLPFGGVGESGIGSYHGKASFDTFSHWKSVLRRGLWLELGWRYAPYNDAKLKQIKKIIAG